MLPFHIDAKAVANLLEEQLSIPNLGSDYSLQEEKSKNSEKDWNYIVRRLLLF